MGRRSELMENLLYPELRAYGREGARLLRDARQEPLELWEWAGILAALFIVVGITRYSVAGFGLADWVAVALANFLACHSVARRDCRTIPRPSYQTSAEAAAAVRTAAPNPFGHFN
jgi:hypothetical protein